MSENKNAELCEDCQHLVGASGYVKPHPKLEYLSGERMSSPMGSADESYYRCRACGREWLRETGSCGMGWQ